MTDSAADNYRHRLQCAGVCTGAYKGCVQGVCTVVQAGTTGHTRSLHTGEVRAGRGPWPVVASGWCHAAPWCQEDTVCRVAWARQPRPSVQRPGRTITQHTQFLSIVQTGRVLGPVLVLVSDHVLS